MIYKNSPMATCLLDNTFKWYNLNPDPLQNSYFTFMIFMIFFFSWNKPDNTKHGGVGLYYKNSLPLKVRNYFSFNESIVVELKYFYRTLQ